MQLLIWLMASLAMASLSLQGAASSSPITIESKSPRHKERSAKVLRSPVASPMRPSEFRGKCTSKSKDPVKFLREVEQRIVTGKYLQEFEYMAKKGQLKLNASSMNGETILHKIIKRVAYGSSAITAHQLLTMAQIAIEHGAENKADKIGQTPLQLLQDRIAGLQDEIEQCNSGDWLAAPPAIAIPKIEKSLAHLKELQQWWYNRLGSQVFAISSFSPLRSPLGFGSPVVASSPSRIPETVQVAGWAVVDALAREHITVAEAQQELLYAKDQERLLADAGDENDNSSVHHIVTLLKTKPTQELIALGRILITPYSYKVTNSLGQTPIDLLRLGLHEAEEVASDANYSHEEREKACKIFKAYQQFADAWLLLVTHSPRHQNPDLKQALSKLSGYVDIRGTVPKLLYVDEGGRKVPVCQTPTTYPCPYVGVSQTVFTPHEPLPAAEKTKRVRFADLDRQG